MTFEKIANMFSTPMQQKIYLTKTQKIKKQITYEILSL